MYSSLTLFYPDLVLSLYTKKIGSRLRGNDSGGSVMKLILTGTEEVLK